MAEIEKRTGKAVADLFDLIAGTSTGGVLALRSVRPNENGRPHFSAADGVRLYEQEGGRIFNRSAWRRVGSLGSVVDEKYDSAGVESVLQEYFGETRLKDSLTDVMVTSYEIERRIPWFFRSRRAKEQDDYDFPMKLVARASSAAPTYFEPCKIEVSGLEEYYAFTDGAIFANNPSLCAYVEAQVTHPDVTDFMLVSLGTGELTRSIPYDEARDWGLIGWVRPVIDMLMHGTEETVHYQVAQLLRSQEGGRQRYYRFQVRLTEGNDDMDDASRSNLRLLKLLTEEMIHRESASIDRMCADLLRE
jgi:hypothetical protein